MISVNVFNEKPIAVMGLGKSGMSAARSLDSGGAEVWAWDDGEHQRNQAETEGLNLTNLYTCDWNKIQILVLSPGIPDKHPDPHPVATKARTHGCEIICDVDLLARTVIESKFIGITGTNGKSTTTALLGHILSETGRTVEIGGNFGVPALELEPLDSEGTYVLELSSYQLERIPSISLNVSILLNISSDHLDRHGGMEGYVNSKKLIFDRTLRGGVAIISLDDPICRSVSLDLMISNQSADLNIIPISANRRVPGGVYMDRSTLVDDIGNEQLSALDLKLALTLPGQHNFQNTVTAFAAARALGVDRDDIARAILSFSGLPHRQELVRIIGKVRYINDSKATNCEAATRALACYQKVHWIAGGSFKELDLRVLHQHLDCVERVYLIGETSNLLKQELENLVSVIVSGCLEAAVLQAHDDAQKAGHHGVVLLSPACASFDQFPNFEARGDCFRAFVEQLV